jgi:hypothetical protein
MIRLSGLHTGNEKVWRNLMVDSGLKEEWLNSLNSVPGVEIGQTCEGHVISGAHQKAHFEFQALLPGGHEDDDTQDQADLEDLVRGHFEDIADVRKDISPFSRGFQWWIEAKSPRVNMSEEEFETWWQTAVERLQMMTASLPVQEPSRDDLRREILYAIANAIAWHGQKFPWTVLWTLKADEWDQRMAKELLTGYEQATGKDIVDVLLRFRRKGPASISALASTMVQEAEFGEGHMQGVPLILRNLSDLRRANIG